LRPVSALRAGAAVAVVIAPREDDAHLLFIRRPNRPGDRWSGDLAFPGGLARVDESIVACARREAHEEVGLTLGKPLGCLRDRHTAHPRRARPMRVRPIVFEGPADRHTVLDPREVAEAFWVPLRRLVRLPRVLAVRRVGRVSLPVPALDLDGRILWGLTLGMTLELRGLVRRSLEAL
jgi:8-oxo-dGTP pyrophosphatase MutT (NUDIX family)